MVLFYFKVVLAIMFFVGWFGILLPYTISYNNDIVFGFGVLLAVIGLPTQFWLFKQVYLDVKKFLMKGDKNG